MVKEVVKPYIRLSKKKNSIISHIVQKCWFEIGILGRKEGAGAMVFQDKKAKEYYWQISG